MSAGFEDDSAFKNLSKSERVKLHRLSYHCSQIDCPKCDGIIRYKFMKEVEGYHEDGGGYYSAKTGEFVPKKQEMFEWDPEFNSVQLKGDVQTKINTPEGAQCECFCHARPKNPNSIGTMVIHKYAQNELAPEVAERGT